MNAGTHGWGMLERTQVHDYVVLQGLSTLTGCEAEYLDILCLKELVDNGLDASSMTTPSIKITLDKSSDFLTLTARDNGKGLPHSYIKRITDFSKLYSTKYHDKTPTRGALGNAFKVILGTPYALAAEVDASFPRPPIRIRSNMNEYNIELQVDELRASVDSTISRVKVETEGTEVSIILPIYNVQWGWQWRYLPLLRGYALFNPEADLTMTLHRDGKIEPFKVSYPPVGERKRKFKGRPSIHWFRKTEFRQLVYAKFRAVRQGEIEEPIRKFIGGFRGLSRYDRINEVIQGAEIVEEVQNVSDLAGREDLADRIFDAIKLVSPDPKPYVMGEIGEKAIKDRLGQIFGELERFKYGIIRETHSEGAVQTPYVLETAVGVFPKNTMIKRSVFVGVNHSPCLMYNPFDRCLLTWSQKGEDHVERGVVGLLEKYGIKRMEPVVMVIHLISPRVEYTSYGKAQMNTEPFERSLAQILYRTCNFYYHHKRAQGHRKVGQKSVARRLLVEELSRRGEMLRRMSSIPEDERSTQQGLYYKIRKKMRGTTDITRESLIAAISSECRALGRKREELGIFAAVRAEMYFRGNVYPVSWNNLRQLAEKGSDIILVEKEGVSIALEPYARRRGVALVNSRGFIVEYAKDLMDLSLKYDANIFQLTDLDASGLLISTKVAEIPRIGIDNVTVARLGLKLDDVAERYKPHGRHLKALPRELRESVKSSRIEIDSVLEEVGTERFWGHLENRMTEHAPRRDLTRSVDLSINLPEEIATPIDWLTEHIKALGKPRRGQIELKLREWGDGFMDVPESERQFQAEIAESISEDRRIKELSKALNELVLTFREKNL